MELGIAGKVAVVTGGSRGIGRATALRLACEGAQVAICARDAAGLETAVGELRALGATAHGIAADVTAPGETERVIEEAVAALGGVDLLVANVGGMSGRTFLATTVEDWLKTFELNVFHAVRAIRAAAPRMAERGGGSAVVIASISGWKAGPRAHYGAAKAAEVFLAGSLAWELAPQRVRVNTVSPGSTIFPGGGWDAYRARNPEEFARFEREEFPWGRLGAPEEIADVVAFVLSERASWINGANIPVDGAQGRPDVFAKLGE